jgi:hypothetical protein
MNWQRGLFLDDGAAREGAVYNVMNMFETQYQVELPPIQNPMAGLARLVTA